MRFARLASSRWLPLGLAPAPLIAPQLAPQGCYCEETSSSSLGSTKLLRVSYMSTMRGDPSAARQDIERIVEKAIPSNQKANLSGHLCYDSKLKVVWQVLEGSRETVVEQLDRIRSDARHIIDEDTVTVEEVDSRRYPLGWGLRFTPFNDSLPLCSRAAQLGGQEHEVEVRDGELIQLAYKSTVADQSGEEKYVIERIVPHAMVNNAKQSITGWMLYNDRTLTIYQILEGPKEAVEGLWNRISQDPRHTVMTESVQLRVIEYRHFPNWSMAMDEVEQTPWASQGY